MGTGLNPGPHTTIASLTLLWPECYSNLCSFWQLIYRITFTLCGIEEPQSEGKGWFMVSWNGRGSCIPDGVIEVTDHWSINEIMFRYAAILFKKQKYVSGQHRVNLKIVCRENYKYEVQERSPANQAVTMQQLAEEYWR